MISKSAAWRRLGLTVLIVLALDQASKAIVVGSVELGERIQVLPFLDLVHVRNEGVAFGFLGGSSQTLVVGVTLLAIVLVGIWFALSATRPGAWLAVGLLGGGAIGNLADRVTRDAVIDFIDFPAWPSFNVADIAITGGALLLVWTTLTAPADE